MKKKLLNQLTDKSVDSIKKFSSKTLPAAVAGTLAATSFANATDVTVSTATAITATNISEVASAANENLIITGGITATLALSVTSHAGGTTDYILGDSDTAEITILDINQTSALTFDAIIKSEHANSVTGITIDDNASIAAPDTITFNRAVTVDTIIVGNAGETAGDATFNAAVAITTGTINGGDASEVSKVTFSSTVAVTININDDDAEAQAIFSGTTAIVAATIQGTADGEGTVQITGSGKTFTGGIGETTGLQLLNADASVSLLNEVDFRDVDLATGVTLTTDDAFQGDVTTLTGTAKFISATDAGGTATSAIGFTSLDGDDDGNGTIQVTNTSVSTFTGAIGVIKQLGLVDLDTSTTFVGVVDTAALTLAASATATFDDDLTATATTLTTSGIMVFAVDANGAAATTVTGTINGAADDGGTLNVTNTNVTTFAGEIGTTNNILLLNLDRASTFNENVNSKGFDSVNSMLITVKKDMTIGATKATLNGTAAELTFTGTTAQTFTGEIIGAGAEQGVIDNANTSATVTFATNVGATELKEVELDASTTTVFSGTVKTALADWAGDVTLSENGNVADSLVTVATSTIRIEETVVNGETVFTTSDTVGEDAIHSSSTMILPVNLRPAETLKLFVDVDGSEITALLADVNATLTDDVLRTFNAAATDTDDVTITSSEVDESTVASTLSVTTSEARALKQAYLAAVNDTTADATAEANFKTVLQTSATAGSNLALQLSPQEDGIVGSTKATQAMTGTVQGIVANRMASLRSGDAYVAGMTAGNGMTANSGFIQAFGSSVEQGNVKTSSSGALAYGYDAETQGVAIGFDGVTENGSTIGISASYSDTDVTGLGTGQAKNNVDSYTVSVYADKATDSGYVEGSLTFGTNANKGSRKVTTDGFSRNYSSKYNSQQVSMNIAAGSPSEISDGTFVTPFISGTGTIVSTDSYTETSDTTADALRLSTTQADHTSIVGSLGVKAHKVTDSGTPMISLAINNEFGDQEINTTNTYTGGGTAFKTDSDVVDLTATLGLGYSFGNDMTSISLGYQAEADDDEYISHYGSLKIVSKF